jgi:uncharacterized protein with GYD domain
MVRYIALLNWTEQGAAKVSETVDRAERFAKAAEKAGVHIVNAYWTVGEYDGVLIIEAPDETAAVAAMARLAKTGNVRTRTLRAFDAQEMRQIVGRLK